MSTPVVWLDIRTTSPDATANFFTHVLGYTLQPGPGFAMLAVGDKPFAGLLPTEAPSTWLPYFEVEDLDRAGEQAVQGGGTIVRERTKGPAGDYLVAQDPGGVLAAFWCAPRKEL
ncbi:VOC family protein [Mesorhizobium marinum]|uniref:VOC family protein n=1 Tax=Mesorhizobium marinum TaxID=3228790 RepID=UPI003466F7A5